MKVLNGHLREVVDIDKMTHGFMPGKVTVDAVFVLRRLSQKFRAKNEKLFFLYLLTWRRHLIGCQRKRW